MMTQTSSERYPSDFGTKICEDFDNQLKKVFGVYGIIASAPSDYYVHYIIPFNDEVSGFLTSGLKHKASIEWIANHERIEQYPSATIRLTKPVIIPLYFDLNNIKSLEVGPQITASLQTHPLRKDQIETYIDGVHMITYEEVVNF